MLSGLLYLPMPLATMFVAPVSGSFSYKFDSRYLSTCGAFIMACGLFMLSLINIGTPIVYIVVSMLVTGIGFDMFQTPNNSVMGNVRVGNRQIASGALATMRNIGIAIAVAVSGALFSGFQTRAEKLYSLQGITGTQLSNNAFTCALHYTFPVAAVVALIAMATSFTKGKVKPAAEKN